MKYLKMFEDNSPLYKRISFGDHQTLKSGDQDKSLYRILLSMIVEHVGKENILNTGTIIENIRRGTGFKKTPLDIMSIEFKTGKLLFEGRDLELLEIVAFDDEWISITATFGDSRFMNYYKCDGRDGFQEFLEEEVKPL